MDEKTRLLIDQADEALNMAVQEANANTERGDVGAHYLIVYLGENGKLNIKTSLPGGETISLLAVQVAETVLSRVVDGTVDEYITMAPRMTPDQEEQN